MNTQPPPSHNLAAYLLQVAPLAAVQAIARGAKDGTAYWRDFIDKGAGDVIVADPKLQRALFRGLWSDDDLPPHSPEIFAAFLARLSDDSRRQFLDGESLADKNHPAGHVFRSASYPTEKGRRYLQMLDHLVQHGLRGNTLFDFVEKFHRRQHLVRATFSRDQAFVRLVVGNLDVLPTSYLREIVGHEDRGPAALGFLVRDCGVALSSLLTPDVVSFASAESYNTLRALEARA